MDMNHSKSTDYKGWVAASCGILITFVVVLFVNGLNRRQGGVPILDRKGRAKTKVVRVVPIGFKSWDGGMWMLRIHAEVHNPTFEPMYIKHIMCTVISDKHGPYEHSFTGTLLNKILGPKETVLVTTQGGFGQDKDTKVVGVRCFPVYGWGKLDKSFTQISIKAWDKCDLVFDMCEWNEDKEQRVRAAGNPY